jgi:hypothetical protein
MFQLLATIFKPQLARRVCFGFSVEVLLAVAKNRQLGKFEEKY